MGLVRHTDYQYQKVAGQQGGRTRYADTAPLTRPARRRAERPNLHGQHPDHHQGEARPERRLGARSPWLPWLLRVMRSKEAGRGWASVGPVRPARWRSPSLVGRRAPWAATPCLANALYVANEDARVRADHRSRSHPRALRRAIVGVRYAGYHAAGGLRRPVSIATTFWSDASARV